ncbi:cytochrome c3 family protein [Geomonas sp.]|uniref:cytochrome c3 family protein n=1 Tax=Geomonas sp. TaxID=2651584 RepID=UPI002B48E048|nr:cytochrome c3 family protein [Geomonas sp.]HJV34245.1 cytochrome c3 family protein [Geomonas sp.]
MKRFVGKVIALAVLVTATQAIAVPAGKSVDWQTPMGKVVFKGDDHAGKGLKCSECHPKVFAMKREAKFKMADIYAGKYCGTCHNGKRAFAAKGNCTKCHKK